MVSDKALVTWALAPTAALERLALPTALQHTIANTGDMYESASGTTKIEQPTAFDVDRFGADG